jgi:hypothetical protein
MKNILRFLLKKLSCPPPLSVLGKNPHIFVSVVFLSLTFKSWGQQSTYTVSSRVTTENNFGMAVGLGDVSVFLANSNPATTCTKITPSDGYYNCSLPAPFSGITTLTCSFSNGALPLDGVTTRDITLINEHILSLTPITELTRLLSADVNGSGSITAADPVVIRQLILGIIQSFPVPSWRFLPFGQYFTEGFEEGIGDGNPFYIFTAPPASPDYINYLVSVHLVRVSQRS